METSLVEDCHRCIKKGHESWKSYFSKWEALGKTEEGLSENELRDARCENTLPSVEKSKKRRKKLQAKRKLDVSSSLASPSSSSSSRSLLKKRSTQQNKNKKEKVSPKNKEKGKKIIGRPEPVSNGSLAEDVDNGQLEVNLRTIFMDILKGNKNKWEIFSVLSQTFSHEEVTIKGSHNLVSDQHLGVTSNDIKMDSIKVSSRNRCVLPSPERSFNNDTIQRTESFYGHFRNEILDGTHCTGSETLDRRSVPDGFNYVSEDFDKNPLNQVQTSHKTSDFGCSMRNSVVNNSPSASSLQSRLSKQCNQRFRRLDSMSFDSYKYFGSYLNKQAHYIEINMKNFGENVYLREKPAQMNFQRQKSFQNLFLYERTRTVSENMENLNFITPKRKPSERKCFSENVAKRKKRRPSKLSFLDYEEDSDSDDHTENRSPVIRWESKKQKIEPSPKASPEDSDSDENEKILDRVHKLQK